MSEERPEDTPSPSEEEMSRDGSTEGSEDSQDASTPPEGDSGGGSGSDEEPREEDGTESDEGAWRRRLGRWGMPLLVVLLPLAVYVPWIRMEFTFGDGAELLTAIMTAGGAHPSGYPLYTLLGMLPAHLPVATPFFNVVLWLSAVPTALTGLLIYYGLRELDAGHLWAASGALLFAFNDTVIYQATKLEVYALHCLLLTGTVYALIRFEKEPHRLRWGYLAVLSTCLALTNHLTSATMILPVVVALVLIGKRRVMHPKPIAIMFGIAIGCALIYLYLPLHAMAHHTETISWNNPQTFDRFWYHITGKEYTGYRKFDHFGRGARRFFQKMNSQAFPGFWLLCALGFYEGFVRHWRAFIPLALYVVAMVAYVATYDINDINTYYPALYLVGALTAGLGIAWGVRARRPRRRWPRRFFYALVICSLLGWAANMIYANRGEAYRDALAQDLSEYMVLALPENGVVFTSVDGHTFPMWYQKYVNHPEAGWLTIDLTTKSKSWYRDHLRKRYPELNWPPERIFRSSRFEKWFIEHNPDREFYALLAKPWKPKGSIPVVQGWYHRIVPEERAEALDIEPTKWTKHIYMARHEHIYGQHYFFESQDVYEVGTRELACVVEWWNDHDPIEPQWHYRGPGDAKHDVDVHPVPGGSNVSWDYLPVGKQVPGEWECSVELEGERPLRRRFRLVPKGELESIPEGERKSAHHIVEIPDE
jgi:hypothetical protein